MPLYEFKCPKCEERFEKLFKVRPSETEEKNIKCPKCGVVSKRLISTTKWINFHGIGFFVNDYKS